MARRSNDPVEIDDVECLREAGATLVMKVAFGVEVLIPTSQIHPTSEVQDVGDEGTLVIPEWLAIDRGLV
jgi:hypothetical protein